MNKQAMEAGGPWLQFEIAGELYALSVVEVAQVVGLHALRPVGAAGWVGLLPVRDGLLPMADGVALLEHERDEPAQGRGLVIRGRHPLGFTADSVLGVTTGEAHRLISRVGLPQLAEAALPCDERAAVVLNADRLWRRLWAGVRREPGGSRYRLLGLVNQKSEGSKRAERARRSATPRTSGHPARRHSSAVQAEALRSRERA